MTATLGCIVTHLPAVVTTLGTAHPEANARVQRGAALVAAGAVERCACSPVIWWVRSATDASQTYTVIRCGAEWTCDCPDHHERQVTCKHAWAAIIAQACERLDAEQGDPTPANVVPFPVPTYTDADRFTLTPLGLAVLDQQGSRA